METKLSRPKSLTDLAVERIRSAIVEGRLAIGAQISESALAAQFGISKTPVREALLRLKLDGLVEIHPQRGTFVFRLDDEEVAEICRFREILESAALAEAMSRDRDALLGRLDANIRDMARAHRSREARKLPQLDADFHGAILELCGNAYLRAAYGLIEHKIHALRWRLPEDNDQVEHCQDNHAVIVEQIREGNVGKAQTTLKRHIRETLDAYLEASHGAALTERQSA
ncbi:MAG TPA: GntR family transcriptional regulator [Burkholderiaceae bacterium]|nr:GntR family transcriptional regulator [Burkholderiaceae bacterium]